MIFFYNKKMFYYKTYYEYDYELFIYYYTLSFEEVYISICSRWIGRLS